MDERAEITLTVGADTVAQLEALAGDESQLGELLTRLIEALYVAQQVSGREVDVEAILEANALILKRNQLERKVRLLEARLVRMTVIHRGLLVLMQTLTQQNWQNQTVLH
jgi:hypothetical protein